MRIIGPQFGSKREPQVDMTKAQTFGNVSIAVRVMRVFTAALVTLCLGFSLSACGKRGSPEPPPGKKSDFPRPYPDPKSY